MRSPILFLDIDGVLRTLRSLSAAKGVPADSPAKTDAEAVAELNRVIEATGARVVVSSTWRLERSLDDLRGLLESWGVRCEVIGKTPRLQKPAKTDSGFEYMAAAERGSEIAQWIDEHEALGPFAIIDDDSDMGELLRFLVKTDFSLGLTPDLADAAIALLTDA